MSRRRHIQQIADDVEQESNRFGICVCSGAANFNCSVGDGVQQGLEYAATLGVPFVFSSNGDGFVFHDRTGAGGEVEKNLSLGEFPSPTELWTR